MAALLAFALLAGSAEAKPAASPVISQVSGGGGNVGAQYRNDFIEVFNRKGSALDLSGWSVQYAPATSASWSVTPLSGTLEIGQYFLAAQGSGGAAGALLPAADATGTIDMSNTSGKVALVSSFTPLTGTCPTGPQIIDLVGYGTTANCFEGAPTPNLSNTTAALRKAAGCTDTASNSSDFSVLAPTPRNSASGLNLCFRIPAAPVPTETAPPSPSSDQKPAIIGSAPAGTSVELYTDAACSGAPVATGTAEDFEKPGITAVVPADSTTTFYALAFDANNSSGCSAESVTYVNDTIAPPAPTLISTSPPSPANDQKPEVRGSAGDGTTVTLYEDESCKVGPAASGSADEFASPGLTVGVPADSITTFYATATDAAGNVSPCSTSSITYEEDSSLPVSPTFTGSAPASAASDTTPSINGTAEPGSTVRLYTDADCTDFAGEGTVAQFESSGISVTVPENSSTTFRATATDAVGNTSACSPDTLTYVEDSTAPPAPTFDSSSPASPAADNSPRLIGDAEPDSTVRIFRDEACTLLSADGAAEQFAKVGIEVTVPSNSSTTFYATATDPLGNTSGCSVSSLTYVEDSAPPAQPVLTSSDPPSPSTETTPLIIGGADAGSTVQLYSDAACTALAGTGSAEEFGTSGIPVTVAPNSTTTFHATATDSVGNGSACSASSLTYENDTAPPAAPTLISTSPPSPANDLSPEVRGSAAAGTTVKLYTDADCGTQLASGTAQEFASPGITATVGPDSTTTFYATATDALDNESACSTSSVTYVQDSGLPVAPTLTGSSPASPASDTSPSIKGTAEEGSTVRLYTDADCTVLAGTGSAAQFASSGISVAVVPNSSTTFRATATDGVGNTSACSPSSYTYVEDSAAPAEPTFTSSAPATPAADNSPRLIGDADAGSTVRIYRDAACTVLSADGTAAQFAGPGIEVTVPSNSSTTFHATATDAVGNTSACSASSFTYVEDSAPPAQPVLSSSNPPSPSTDTTPLIIGSADPGSTVRLYTDAACTVLAGSGSAGQLAAPGIEVTVAPDSTTTFHAIATDEIGNGSACSASSLTYENDAGAPAPPTLTTTNRASSSSSTAPRILGSAEPGSTVRIYTDSGCTALAATGTAAELAFPGIKVSVPEGSTTTFRATATDALDNTSACSPDSVTYTQATPPAPSTDEAVPGLSGLFLDPPKFAIEMKPTVVGAGSAKARGTVINFTLSARARVGFTVLRRPQVAQAPSPSAGLVKTFGRVLAAGEHAVPFTGRLGQRLFRPGKYRMVVTAQVPSGGGATSASAPFTILKP